MNKIPFSILLIFVCNITFAQEIKNGSLVIETGQKEKWENPGSFYGHYISVEAGATLSIISTLKIAPGTKFIVKRGGKLIIDGATITGHDNEMWPGIEIWGTASATQNPEDQGWLKIINGGTIENAEIAIRTIREIDDGSEGVLDYDYTGGIVQATDANFINNEIAVCFYDYDYQSLSGFSDCDFITDDDYLGTTNPDYFVKMNEVNGIAFSYCRFTNDSDNDCYGNGIYSFNSGFNVNGKCLSGQQPCSSWAYGEFTNLKRGIYATSGGSLYFPEVDHITFTGNNRSVYFSAMENGTITNCTITTGPLLISIGWPYGIYLDYSTGYKIEENSIYQGVDAGIGMVINNSGREANRIYLNYFEGLSFGIMALNKNRAPDGTGLELRCNTYEDMQMDELVLWEEGQFMSKEYGIAESQGSPGSSPEDMAGNLFDYHGESNNDFDDIDNEANHITYYSPSSAPGFSNRIIPTDYTQSTVSLEIAPNVTWSYEVGCPPEENSGGSGDEDELKNQIAQTNQKIDSTQLLLGSLIDDGNTDVLQNNVETSNPPEAIQIYSDLMNKSPYLSDTVISTAIEKEEVLPGAMIRDIMVANPNTAKSNELMNKLDERWDPLPEYMIAQILQGRSIVSIREETQSQLAAYKQQKAKMFNALARVYINDTNYYPGSSDSLQTLLEADNSINTKYSLAFLKGESGSWNEGLAVLNGIPLQFELTNRQNQEHQQYLLLYDLLADLSQQGQRVIVADSNQIEILEFIEQADAGKASACARSILIAIDEIEYDEPILMPDLLKSSTALDEYKELLDKAKEAPRLIKFLPNPAKDYVILEYNLEYNSEAVVEIKNIEGNLKYKKYLKGIKNQVVIETTDWNPGLYIGLLKVKDKLVESIKFTVID